MKWRPFLIANAAGAIVWAMAYGLGAFYFGASVTELSGSAETWLIVAAGATVLATIVLLRRYEDELSRQAEHAMVPDKTDNAR